MKRTTIIRVLLLSFVGLVGSACGGDDDGTLPECRVSSQCFAGLLCIDQQCVRPDAGRDAGSFSFDAGKPDTGHPDAGARDAGRPDAAGEPDTGGPDAGTDAGDTDANIGSDAGTCGSAFCELARAWCGEVTDQCEQTVDCGDCPNGFECSQNQCVQSCQPRSCPANSCDYIDDGCGGRRDCGGCGNGQNCRNNQCVNVCNCSPIQQCRNGGCECRDQLHRGIRLGDMENSRSSAEWDEFANYSNPHPTYYVGQPVSQLRPWIGHSTCPTCTPGTVKKQRLNFSGLVPGVRYILAVYPAWITGNARYSALIAHGNATIESGGQKQYTGYSGHVGPEAVWRIQFVAHSESVGLDLGHGTPRTDIYMYIDYYDFAPQHPCP